MPPSPAGILTLTTGTGADLSITGKADLLKALGLTTSVGAGDATVTKARDDRCRDARHADPGRLDAERQRQDHHVQERCGSGGCERARRLGLQRQPRHRRQRQLDRLSAGRDARRHAQRDRSRHRRQDRGELRRYGHVDNRSGRLPRRSQRAARCRSAPAPTADLSIVGTGNALSALGLTGNTGNEHQLHRGPLPRRLAASPARP